MPPVPTEIGFLIHYGVSSACLANVAATARRQGVTADRVLLAEGHVSEDHFYRALAHHLRITFIDGEAVLRVDSSYPQTVRTGIAPFVAAQKWTFLLAPRGEAVARLIYARQGGGPSTNHLVLTTPGHFSNLVRKGARKTITRSASFGLSAIDADLTARRGMNDRQILALGAFASALAFFLPLAPLASAVACLTLLCVAFLAVLWLRLSACAASRQPICASAPELRDSDLPIYSVVVALYREAAVVPQLLAAINDLSYPRAKLDVKLVVEEDDHETLAALERADILPFCEIIVAPAGLPRTKPRALNVALPMVRGELVAVYDAEDIPDPLQLRLAAARFAAAPTNLACLQARLAIDNIGDGWLPQLFAIEYAGLFDVLNVGLSALGMPVPLGGSSNHFRVGALRHVGGWDAWNVTEDADIGLRFARFGYGSETLASTTYEEAPKSIAAFFNQRRRWCKGWYQTLIVLSRRPFRLVRQLGPARVADLVLVLASNILGSLAAPLWVIGVSLDFLLGARALPADTWGTVLATLSLSVIIAGIPATLWPVLLGMKRRHLGRRWPSLCLLPAYYIIICAAAWTALADLVTQPHHWQKTPHGEGRRGSLKPLRNRPYSRAGLRAVRNIWLTLSDISI